MKRWIALMLALALMLACAAAGEAPAQTGAEPAQTEEAALAETEEAQTEGEAPQTEGEPSQTGDDAQWPEARAPEDQLRLSGVKIGIDPGHQAHANWDKEAVAPGSSKMKAKVSSGTEGVKTHVPEYALVLDVAFKLRDALEALGAEVYMTRESNDVDISNQERAIMMNELGVDLVLRLHCDGSEKKSTNGIGMYVTATGDIAEASYRAAQCLMPRMTEATGARAYGIYQFDTYTGLNWSTVPCILLEMGFMSNPEEDVKLNDPAYQALLVLGMVEGICDFTGRGE